jgi:hypothetical protein
VERPGNEGGTKTGVRVHTASKAAGSKKIEEEEPPPSRFKFIKIEPHYLISVFGQRILVYIFIANQQMHQNNLFIVMLS